MSETVSHLSASRYVAGVKRHIGRSPMPRPKKWRNVCRLPYNREYGPLDKDTGTEEFINMTIEEYETIRLMDHMGMIQEECADRMGIARTTVQEIYSKARKKMAKSLVEGISLIIEGGSYKVCEFSEDCHRRKTCRRKQGLNSIYESKKGDKENEDNSASK